MREIILIVDNLDSLFVVSKLTLLLHTCEWTSQHLHRFLWSHFNQPVVVVPMAALWQLSCDFSSPSLAFQERATSLPRCSYFSSNTKGKRGFFPPAFWCYQVFFINFLISPNIFHAFLYWLKSFGGFFVGFGFG